MSLGSFTASIIGTISLNLTSANGYEVDNIGPGARSFRREVIQSPYVAGRELVGLVLDFQTIPLDVWVGGASAAQLATRIENLLEAVEQFSYNVRAVIDGVTYEWACEPADSAPGNAGTFEVADLGAFQQVMHLTIPRHPTPVSGPV